MIAGVDSALPPSSGQVVQARAAGITIWSGYLATKPGVGLYHPWNQGDFTIAKNAGNTPLAYCSGWDDPAACKSLAAAWGVRLCLDVEGGIRGDGAWVQPWLDASGAGLYGNEGVHPGRSAAFHVLAAYPGYNPNATWASTFPHPGGPVGWQWQGTHTQFGIGVDSTWFDDWFGQSTTVGDDMIVLVNTPSEGIWMLSGSLYCHVDDPAVLNSLQATGACSPQPWTIDENMHQGLVAARAGSTSPFVVGATGSSGLWLQTDGVLVPLQNTEDAQAYLDAGARSVALSAAGLTALEQAYTTTPSAGGGLTAAQEAQLTDIQTKVDEDDVKIEADLK